VPVGNTKDQPLPLYQANQHGLALETVTNERPVVNPGVREPVVKDLNPTTAYMCSLVFSSRLCCIPVNISSLMSYRLCSKIA